MNRNHKRRRNMLAHLRLRTIVIPLLVHLMAAVGTFARQPADGAGVLRAMHDRYADNWYDTLTFKQDSTTHNPDGKDTTEIWYEAVRLPGQLRIDVGQPQSPNVRLIAANTFTQVENNEIKASRPFTHMLLVLGFDVYKQPVDTTIAQVKAQGFDLSKLHEDTWEGKPVYVVGADKGDLKSKQFWIEKDRLLFVRLIEPDRRDPAKTNDTRFGDYRQFSVGFVAARVDFYVEGKDVFTESYSDIKVNPKLDPAFFDPQQFKPQQDKPRN
jgi:hypothetical protein